MNKKTLSKLRTLYESGVGEVTCIQALLELSDRTDSHALAEDINTFYYQVIFAPKHLPASCFDKGGKK